MWEYTHIIYIYIWNVSFSWNWTRSCRMWGSSALCCWKLRTFTGPDESNRCLVDAKLPYISEKQIVKLWCLLTCFQLFHFWTFWQNSFDPLYFFRLSHNVRCVCVCAHRFSNFWTLNLRYLQFVVPFPSFPSNKRRLDGATSQRTKSDLWWSWHFTDSYNATGTFQ